MEESFGRVLVPQLPALARLMPQHLHAILSPLVNEMGGAALWSDL